MKVDYQGRIETRRRAQMDVGQPRRGAVLIVNGSNKIPNNLKK